ncbi:MAG: PQQ-binding-like beta-propeller repeat protein [Bacteroidetes bacterium]|nr:PQQ-binding-like beta-propeller repeat protein [Bacteroidota bacterium]
MKQVLTTIILAILNIVAIAQKFPKDLSVSHSISASAFGYNVPVKKYNIGYYRVVSYNSNAEPNLLYLGLQDIDKNYIVCIDIERDSVVYQHKIKGDIKDIIGYQNYFTKETYVNENQVKTTIYNAQSGDKILSTTGIFPYVNSALNIGISKDGSACDMNTGKQLWQTSVDARFGWGAIEIPDSNSVMICANGLRYIDVRDGNGWYHPLSTGKEKYGSMIATNAIGITTAILTGFGTYRTGPDILYGAHSNITTKENVYYLAGMDEMIAVRQSGKMLWKVKLPYTTGASVLSISGDTMFVVGRGYSYFNGRVVNFGDAYIAAYNTNDGKLLYTTPPLAPKTTVLDMGISDYRMLLVCNNSLQCYNLNNGKPFNAVSIKDDNTTIKGFYRVYAGKAIYTDTAIGSTQSFYNIYPDNFFLKNDEGDILRLSTSLKPEAIIRRKDFFLKVKLNDSLYGRMGKDRIYIDKDDKRIMQVNVLPNKTIGNKLIWFDKGSITIMDLSGL